MIKKTDNFSVFLLMICFLLTTSCNSNITFTDSIPVPEEKWDISNILSFRIPVGDTLSANNISFNIRTGSSYPFRNIHLFVSTTSPLGKSITDTVEYFLADEKGIRYGKGFGDIKELNLPFKNNVFFPVKGIYQIRIQHGMRIETLKGIYDFGLRVEKIKN